MNRRERHLHIIESFGRSRMRDALADILIHHGLIILTDDGLEKVTRLIVERHKLQQRYNREYRAARRAS